MHRQRHCARVARSVIAATLCSATAAIAAEQPGGAIIMPVLSRALEDMPGKEATLLTVEYAPGAATPSRRHNAHTFVYVLEGTIAMQIAGGETVTLGPGQTFYESPHDVHTVSRNASADKPAKFLVFFIKDKNAPAVLPVQ